MSQDRQPYVKPVVEQLQYMVDQHVSIAAGCKNPNASQGSAQAGCLNRAATNTCNNVAS